MKRNISVDVLFLPLSFAQVHTFYEAVGYMISAQTDQVVQEHLIEKYMMLPNQVWDEIINQASRVSDKLWFDSNLKSYYVDHILEYCLVFGIILYFLVFMEVMKDIFILFPRMWTSWRIQMLLNSWQTFWRPMSEHAKLWDIHLWHR